MVVQTKSLDVPLSGLRSSVSAASGSSRHTSAPRAEPNYPVAALKRNRKSDGQVADPVPKKARPAHPDVPTTPPKKLLVSPASPPRLARSSRVALSGVVLPKKPVGGGYGVFANNHRAEFMRAAGMDSHFRGVGGFAGVAQMTRDSWARMSNWEKKVYDLKFRDLMDEYRRAKE